MEKERVFEELTKGFESGVGFCRKQVETRVKFDDLFIRENICLFIYFKSSKKKYNKQRKQNQNFEEKEFWRSIDLC